MKNYRTLLTHSTKIGGAAVGGAVGSLAGPAGTVTGAAIGAAVAETCTVVLDDLANRWLSPKEEQRVAGVAALAIEQIRERLLWETRREDDFFEGDTDAPSPAEELLEGVLLTAKQEHEQLKLPYLANFYTNLVFAPYVQRHEANHLLGLVEGLTYRQLCILSLASQLNEYDVRDEMWRPKAQIDAESLDVAQQSLYLFQRQLLISYSKDQERAGFVHEVSVVIPAFATVSSTGTRVVELFGLKSIPKHHLSEIARLW
ncbi:hypothetical protein ACDH53_25115 [Pseudomonas tremae]|uniref:Uncharacterized protein n=1 Tax=Pseudomonas tremae TaxID=200454 RepID=A0ABV4PKM7_9PSED|nr:hypothetical protein [Pseudomonas coronafaciens]